MRKQLLLTGLTAALTVFGTSSAEAQFRQRMGSPSQADQQMKLDPSQFTPEGQMIRLLDGMSLLVKQNQELKAQLDDTKLQLDRMQRRMESIANVLNTTTGESIGNMVATIRNRVAGN
jgi:hypothetical protein